PFSLDPRLADHDGGRREASCDRRHEVASCGCLHACEDSDGARGTWQAPLPLRREEALGGELPLQVLEREEVASDTEPLDRRRTEGEDSLLLEELRAAGDMDGLPLVEVEVETLVRAARNGDRQRRSSLRVL